MTLKILYHFELTQEKRNITLKYFNPDINKGIEEYKAKTHRSLTRQRESTWLSSGRDTQRDAKKSIQNIDCLADSECARVYHAMCGSLLLSLQVAEAWGGQERGELWGGCPAQGALQQRVEAGSYWSLRKECSAAWSKWEPSLNPKPEHLGQ